MSLGGAWHEQCDQYDRYERPFAGCRLNQAVSFHELEYKLIKDMEESHNAECRARGGCTPADEEAFQKKLYDHNAALPERYANFNKNKRRWF